MKKSITLLLVLVFLLGGCQVKQPVSEGDVTTAEPADNSEEVIIKEDKDPPFLSGSTRLLTTDPIVEKDQKVTFTLAVTVAQKQASSLINVFVDTVRVPFSVNDGSFDLSYLIPADNQERTMTFSIDVSSIPSNAQSRISIGQINIPSDGTTIDKDSTNAYYYISEVFSTRFDHTSDASSSVVFESLPVSMMESLDPALKQEIDLYFKENLLEPTLYYTVTVDNSIYANKEKSKNKWFKPITGTADLVFYNSTSETYDIVLHFYKNETFMFPDLPGGFRFTLNPGEGMKLPLDDYQLSGNFFSFRIFIDGQHETNMIPNWFE